MSLIQPGNTVWFHNHAPDASCDQHCYEHPASEPTKRIPHRFVRIDGRLHMVFPITKPSTSQPYVLVQIRDGEVRRFHVHDIILSY